MNDEPQPGGDFSAWMAQVQGAIRGEGASEVPCGRCTACCTASQFIHIGPDETDTLSHIDHPWCSRRLACREATSCSVTTNEGIAPC